MSEEGKSGNWPQDTYRVLKQAGISKGKVAMFVGRIDMQNSIDRKQGIDETLGKQAGIEILPIFLDGRRVHGASYWSWRAYNSAHSSFVS